MPRNRLGQLAGEAVEAVGVVGLPGDGRRVAEIPPDRVADGAGPGRQHVVVVEAGEVGIPDLVDRELQGVRADGVVAHALLQRVPPLVLVASVSVSVLSTACTAAGAGAAADQPAGDVDRVRVVVQRELGRVERQRPEVRLRVVRDRAEHRHAEGVVDAAGRHVAARRVDVHVRVDCARIGKRDEEEESKHRHDRCIHFFYLFFKKKFHTFGLASNC